MTLTDQEWIDMVRKHFPEAKTDKLVNTVLFDLTSFSDIVEGEDAFEICDKELAALAEKSGGSLMVALALKNEEGNKE